MANGRVYLYKHRSLGRRKLGIYSEQEQTIEEIQLPEGKYINAERMEIYMVLVVAVDDVGQLLATFYALGRWIIPFTR